MVQNGERELDPKTITRASRHDMHLHNLELCAVSNEGLHINNSNMHIKRLLMKEHSAIQTTIICSSTMVYRSMQGND